MEQQSWKKIIYLSAKSLWLTLKPKRGKTHGKQPKTPCPPREEIFRHYGYPKDTHDKGIAVGNWEKDDAFERLAFLPELIPYLDKSKKVKIIFDYDPDYPRALLQVTGQKPFVIPLEDEASEDSGK